MDTNAQDSGIEKIVRLRYSWSDFYKDVDALFDKIVKTIDGVDAIVGVARGGFRLGAILAYKCKKPFYAITVKSYLGDKKLHSVFIKKVPTELRGRKILLADDIVDTSDTMKALVDKLKQFDVTVVNKVVLCKKDKVSYECIYARLVEDLWIEFPWE